MGDMIPREMAEQIAKVMGHCLDATNMTAKEAYGFAFRCWQLGYVKPVRCKDCVYNKNGGCMRSEEYDERNYNPEHFCADGLREEDNE